MRAAVSRFGFSAKRATRRAPSAPEIATPSPGSM